MSRSSTFVDLHSNPQVLSIVLIPSNYRYLATESKRTVILVDSSLCPSRRGKKVFMKVVGKAVDILYWCVSSIFVNCSIKINVLGVMVLGKHSTAPAASFLGLIDIGALNNSNRYSLEKIGFGRLLR